MSDASGSIFQRAAVPGTVPQAGVGLEGAQRGVTDAVQVVLVRLRPNNKPVKVGP